MAKLDVKSAYRIVLVQCFLLSVLSGMESQSCQHWEIRSLMSPSLQTHLGRGVWSLLGLDVSTE